MVKIKSFIDRWIKIDPCSSLAELGLVSVTAWSIWSDRNKVIHGDSIPDINTRCQWITHYLEDFLRVNSMAAHSIGSNIQATRNSLARANPVLGDTSNPRLRILSAMQYVETQHWCFKGWQFLWVAHACW